MTTGTGGAGGAAGASGAGGAAGASGAGRAAEPGATNVELASEVPGTFTPTATDYMLASSTLTSADLLRKFSESNEPTLRQHVAGNIAAPQDVFEVLANDPTAAVRIELARNPRIPYHVIMQLARDLSPIVRYSVAESLYTPLPILKKLENDMTEQVKDRARRTMRNLAKAYEIDAVEAEEMKQGYALTDSARTQYENGMALFLQDVQAEFNSLSEQLRLLAENVQNSAVPEESLRNVQDSLDKFQKKVEELKMASEDAWDSLKSETDAAWSELGSLWKSLRQSVERAASKF